MLKIEKIGALFLAIFLIASCNGDPTDTSSDSSESSTSIEVIDEYDDWLNTWSESNHLYIHYL